MEVQIQKLGDNLGIMLPNSIIKDFSFKNGSLVVIEEKNDTILIRPKKKHRLDDMLNSINAQNIHSELDFGVKEGKEIW